MKILLFATLLFLITISANAQTLGEIRIDSTKDDVFREHNAFLRSQPKDNRIVYYTDYFKTDAAMPLQFYAVMNVTSDTVTVEGNYKTLQLAPYASITGEALFENGQFLQNAPYIYVSTSQQNGLLVVHRNCYTCPRNSIPKSKTLQNTTEMNVLTWQTFSLIR